MSSLKLVNHRFSTISALALILLLVCAPFASAASFTIGSGVVEDDQQDLNGGETGTVEAGGAIIVDDSDRGVDMDGDGNTLNNYGEILAQDDDKEGVRIKDTMGNRVNNYRSGSIGSVDGVGLEIDDGDSNTVNNHGKIFSTDDVGLAIDDSDFNTINNYGVIETGEDSGDDALRIDDGTGNIINNYGDIISKRRDGIEINSASGNTINNFGNSIFCGDHCIRIENDSNDNIINNYGLIEAIEDGSGGEIGISVNNGSDGNVINNYGKIFARRVKTKIAIRTDGMTTLNLFSRSQILGRIWMDGDDGDVVNVNFAKAGTSSTLLFEPRDTDLPDINLKNDNMVRVGDRVFVVDPTGPSVQGEALGTLTDKIHGAISNHLLNGPPGNPQLASASVQQGMINPGKGDQVWVSGFGSKRERDEDGRALAYNQNIAGGVAGYETGSRNFRFGGLAGYAHTDVVTDTVSSDTNTSSWFVGGYGRAVFGIINLDVALLAGYEQNDHDRWLVDNLNGFEIAHGNFDSYFLSPSATVSSQFNIMDNISLRPSVTASYSVGFYNSYTERGSTQSNLFIDNRTAHAFITRFQLGTAYIFSPGNEVVLRVGGRYRYTDDGNINASLAGASFQYAAVGDDENFEGLFGGTARLAVKDWVSLTADMEYSLNDIENSLTGQLGLEFTF
jgi:hypothetical protein